MSSLGIAFVRTGQMLQLTEKLVLRSFREGDAHRIVLIADDYDIARQTSKLPYPLDVSDVMNWLGEIANDIVYAITYENEVIGSVSASAHDAEEAELSYWLGKQWWGKGIASEAVVFMVRHLFMDHGFIKLQASHAKDNPGSGRVLEKAGFKNVGPVLYYSRARGEDVPCWTYRLKKADWIVCNGDKL